MIIPHRTFLTSPAVAFLLAAQKVDAFVSPSAQSFSVNYVSESRIVCKATSTTGNSGNPLDSLLAIFDNKISSTGSSKKNFRMAQSLLTSLINDEKCFDSLDGAQKFADSCDLNVVYEDTFEPQPIVGRAAVAEHLRAKVKARIGGDDGTRDAKFRIDKISDGSKACGFAWTWTTSTLEGLRGTTFVELNESNQIQYVREIPEPLYKPGDLTLELLKAVTADATPRDPPEFVQRTPKKANEVAKYLFEEVQGGSVDESMRFFDESIVYRDFNYEDVLKGKDEVRKFIEDFSFPGITFNPQRFDDGEMSTCFTWEVLLEGAPEGESIKGISYYEVNDSGLITYVRDVPESAIKPPILGKLARQFRPALGVFRPVTIGSRDGGM
mmetsp:Transcript_23625/g.47807  ORF Transcript_23625/g.47807 Transcript_23625/m.47807 type:complete len:382 (-) Transcript_23625:54-1199(-)